MRNQHQLSLFLFLGFLFGVAVHAEEQRHQSPHVHGEARLDIALEGSDLVLEFDSPAKDILGFEHEPGNEEEHKKAHEAEEKLRAADSLFKLPENAQCKLSAAEIATGGKMHKQEEKGHEEAAHRDIGVTYAFRCSGKVPAEIEVLLFDAFPSLHKIHAHLTGPNGQKSSELTPNSNRVGF